MITTTTSPRILKQHIKQYLKYLIDRVIPLFMGDTSLHYLSEQQTIFIKEYLHTENLIKITSVTCSPLLTCHHM